MPNTKSGAVQARDTLLARDPDYYKKIGRLGGMADRGNRHKKGYASHRELAVKCGLMSKKRHAAKKR